MDEGLREYMDKLRYFCVIHRCAWCGGKQQGWRYHFRAAYCRSCRLALFSDRTSPPCGYMSRWEQELRSRING